MHFIGGQHAEAQMRSTCVTGVDHILQHLTYVVFADIHILQELFLQYSVHPFGYAVVAWTVAFRHADLDVASAEHLHVWLGAILKTFVRVVYRTSDLRHSAQNPCAGPDTHAAHGRRTLSSFSLHEDVSEDYGGS